MLPRISLQGSAGHVTDERVRVGGHSIPQCVTGLGRGGKQLSDGLLPWIHHQTAAICEPDRAPVGAIHLKKRRTCQHVDWSRVMARFWTPGPCHRAISLWARGAGRCCTKARRYGRGVDREAEAPKDPAAYMCRYTPRQIRPRPWC